MSLLELNKRHVIATLIATCLCFSAYSIDWLLPATQISQTITAGSGPGGFSRTPEIVSDGASTVIAVWTQAGAVFGAKFDVLTKTWSTPDTILPYSSSYAAYNPKAVIVGPNQIIVTWKITTDGTTYNLQGALYIPSNSNPTIENLTNTADVDTPSNEYSLVKYGTNSALVTYATRLTPYQIKSALYTPGGTTPLTWTNISTNAPNGVTNEKRNPFVVVDPTTNIPYVVYAQSDVTASGQTRVLGVPIPISGTTINIPTAGNFTRFEPKSTNAINTFPQIWFNPANNKPVVIWSKELTSTSAQIVGSTWDQPYPTGVTIAVNNSSNVISVQPLTEGNPLRFSVAVDGPNSFKIVYRQNNGTDADTIPVNNVFAAMYVPGVDTITNIQVSTQPSGTLNLHPYYDITNVPQVACLPPCTTSGQVTNIIMWEQADQVWGALYVPGQGITDRQQLSTLTPPNGFVVRNYRTTTTIPDLSLAMALSYGQPIVAWDQGIYDSVRNLDIDNTFYIFGTEGVPAQPATVTLSQEFHRFPRCSDLVNNISLTPAINGAAYQIYLATDLTKPLANLTEGPLSFKHYCRNACKPDTYYIFAIDCAGATSLPVILTAPSF